MNSFKDQMIYFVFSVVLGTVCGAFIWLFMLVLHYGTELLWTVLPSAMNLPYYSLILCTVGGGIMGLLHHYLGAYPETMDTVMKKIKVEKQYAYGKIPAVAVCAILPLLLGASVGPEAGLVGIIAGLCSFVQRKFKTLNKQFDDLAGMGFSMALAVVFQSPIFGFIEPLEGEEVALPKKSKTALYFLTILSAFGVFLLLGNLVPLGHTGIARMDGFDAGMREYLLALPLALIGYVFCLVYLLFEKIMEKISEALKNKNVLKGILSGAALGLIGTALPIVMFSGEHQLADLHGEWMAMSAGMLIGIGLIKLFLTTVCIQLGLKGGHFFPMIFAGISIGYGFSILFDINPVFSAGVITAALVSGLLKKPVATAILLLLCIPLDGIFAMLVGAVIASYLPIPKWLHAAEDASEGALEDTGDNLVNVKNESKKENDSEEKR